MVTSVPSPWERAMRPSFLSWKTIVSVGAALGLLLIVGRSGLINIYNGLAYIGNATVTVYSSPLTS